MRLLEDIPIDPSRFRNRLIAAAALSAVIAASFAYRAHVESGPTLCVFRLLTGVPCPGCGMTRSFCALAGGEIPRAFGFHVLGPVLYAGILVAIPLILVEAFFHVRVTPIYRLVNWARMPHLLFAVLVVFHALRLADLAQSGEVLAGMKGSLMGRVFGWFAGLGH